MDNVMKMLQTVICFTLTAQLAGCGTLLHSERRGQKGGRIDPAIAVLDGIGLLLFIIPGLIAFAIDFSTGAIYLPGTAARSLDGNDMKVATFDPKHTTAAAIEEIIWKETGHRVKLNQANMEVARLGSLEDMRCYREIEIADRQTIYREVCAIMAQQQEGEMGETVLEMPLAKQSDERSSSVTDQTTLVLAQRDASLMTPLGLTAGEVLAEVDSLGATTLRQLIRKLDWPVHLVMMAVGVLVRQGLVRATQRELEVIVEPIPEWFGAAQAEVV